MMPELSANGWGPSIASAKNTRLQSPTSPNRAVGIIASTKQLCRTASGFRCLGFGRLSTVWTSGYCPLNCIPLSTDAHDQLGAAQAYKFGLLGVHPLLLASNQVGVLDILAKVQQDNCPSRAHKAPKLYQPLPVICRPLSIGACYIIFDHFSPELASNFTVSILKPS
jgi:hypothetical protein